MYLLAVCSVLAGYDANFHGSRRTDLLKQVWSKAESKFRASEKKEERLLKEKEQIRKERAEKLNRLRAQRLGIKTPSEP